MTTQFKSQMKKSLKKTADAIALLKASISAAPKELILPVELARLYLNLRQPDNALPYAERAYKLASSEFAALSTLVEVCVAGKLSQRIDEVLRKTLLVPQSDYGFWLRAGDLFRSALMPRGAPPAKAALERVNRLYGKALELAPANAGCLERTADITRSRSSTEMPADFTSALRCFTPKKTQRRRLLSLKNGLVRWC